MSGNPISQVKQALTQIINLSQNINKFKLSIIAYDSTATEIDKKNINSLYAGGGTVFKSAFNKIQELLLIYKNES